MVLMAAVAVFVQLLWRAGACRADAASVLLGGGQCGQRCRGNKGLHAPAIGHDLLVGHCTLVALAAQGAGLLLQRSGRGSTRPGHIRGAQVGHAPQFRLRTTTCMPGSVAIQGPGNPKPDKTTRGERRCLCRSRPRLLPFARQPGEATKGAGACSRPRAMASSCVGAMGRPQW